MVLDLQLSPTIWESYQRTKNKQIALLTVFAMILVVLGHSDITDNYKNLWIYKWVYSFHMPLFFFISGFLFFLTNPTERVQATSYRKFMEKKIVRLIIPYIFINSVIFLVKALLIPDKSLMQHPIELSFPSYIDSTLFHPLGFMWFLPCLFMIFAMSYPILKFNHLYVNSSEHAIAGGGNKQIYSVLAIVLIAIGCAVCAYIAPGLSIMKLSAALHYMPYFLLGMVYCSHKMKIDSFINRCWLLILLISFLVSASLITKGYLAALSGIIFSVTGALLFERKCHDNVIKISALCYTVFLLSYFPQMLIRGPIASKVPLEYEYILSVISFISGITIPILIAKLYNRLKIKYSGLVRYGILIGL